MHNEGAAIWTPIALEGLTNQMMKGNGFGTGWKGLYSTSLLNHHSNWPNRADELSDTLKICMFVGEYFLRHYRGHYYAKAQNVEEVAEFSGGALFEIVLAALLIVFTGGVGLAARGAASVSYLDKLARRIRPANTPSWPRRQRR
jgi:hypothetical protein